MGGYWPNNLKKQQESRHVHNLLAQGKKIVETQAIATEFCRFYEALYNIPMTDTPQSVERQHRDEIRDYIKDASMPTLSNTIIEEIETPNYGRGAEWSDSSLATRKEPRARWPNEFIL